MGKAKAVVSAVKTVGGAVAKYVMDAEVTKTIGAAVKEGINKIGDTDLQKKVISLQIEAEEMKKEFERLRKLQKINWIVFGTVGLILAILIFVVK